LPYLTKAVNWAQAHGLKVIIDLHGVPGSQNGYDNSGQRKPKPEWQNKAINIQRSNAIIQKLANTYRDMTGTVSIIAPLNEPAGYDGELILNVTKQFWYDSYQNIRFPYDGGSRESNTLVLIHDTYQPISYWDNFMPAPKYTGVAVDTHIYQVFSVAENQMSYAQHIQNTCGRTDISNTPLWVIIGEWAPAFTDCAKYLNGRGIGARYDGTFAGSKRVGSCTGLTGQASTFSSSYKKLLRQYWEAQAITYEKAQGWLQWTWKAENADEWSYQAGLANGWIPKNPNDLQYPDICDPQSISSRLLKSLNLS